MISINQGETLKIERTITNLENLTGAVAYLAMTDTDGITQTFECVIANLTVAVELEPDDTQDTGKYTLEIKVWLNGEADTIFKDTLTINKSAIPTMPGA